MSARTRRDDAAGLRYASGAKSDRDLWQEAVAIRQEWLDHGLSTEPADRQAAEIGLTGIYARICRPQPRFEWVDSPYKALPLIADLPTLDVLYRRPAPVA